MVYKVFLGTVAEEIDLSIRVDRSQSYVFVHSYFSAF